MIKTLIFTSCFLSLILADELPDTIKLQGIVRDFRYLLWIETIHWLTISASHVDFEAPATFCREVPGLLHSTLTSYPDNRPVMIPPELRSDSSLKLYPDCRASTPILSRFAVANYGQFYFDEYYQDVPGVNIAFPIEIELTLNKDTGLYRFSDSYFFPINGKGFTREVLELLKFKSVQWIPVFTL